MKKLTTFMVSLLLSVAATSASAMIITFTDSIKRGSAQHMTIDGAKLLLRGDHLGEYNTDDQRYRARLVNTSSNVNWNLNLRIDNISSTFAPGHTPRCPQSEPGCDTSGWLHFTENENRRSTLTQRGGLARYVLDLGWGQYGYNAGGFWVTPQDHLAAGFWIKEWTYQTRADRSSSWADSRTGRGGDVNVYQSVDEPGVLALLGLGGLIMLRRKRAARK